jgi:hypothetical protein
MATAAMLAAARGVGVRHVMATSLVRVRSCVFMCARRLTHRQARAMGTVQAHPTYHCDVLVVGGGIVGLATARELSLRNPRARVWVAEKEKDIGALQRTEIAKDAADAWERFRDVVHSNAPNGTQQRGHPCWDLLQAGVDEGQNVRRRSPTDVRVLRSQADSVPKMRQGSRTAAAQSVL